MSTEIYYFSGTGNSLVVARGIAEQTKGKLIPIASMVDKKAVMPKADSFGIVFPVYYVDIPVIIRKFAEKLDNIKDKYLFAVCTYGGGAGNSFNSLSRIIRSRRGELSAMFGVHMPQNGFFKPWEKHQVIFQKSKKKLKTISRMINLKKKGMPLSGALAQIILYPIQILSESAFRSWIVKASGISDRPNEELIGRLDKDYSTNDNCSGCGICVQVCPVNNIKMADKKPVWLNHCETCLACYHWCPMKAIQGGISPYKNQFFYHHPDIKISDIIKQKQAVSNII